MRTIVRAAAGLAILATVASSASAQSVTVLVPAQPNNSPLLTNFSNGGITVTQSSRTVFGAAGTTDPACSGNLISYNAGYGDLPTAAYACRVGEFHFHSTGNLLTLTNFDIASFLGTPSAFTVAFYGTGYTGLSTSSGLLPGTSTHTVFSGYSSLTDLYVQWDASATFAGSPGGACGGCNIAVDDIRVSATPEPASLALFATGFVGLSGFVRYRRRKTTNAV